MSFTDEMPAPKQQPPWVLAESKDMPGSYDVTFRGRLIGRALRWADTKWSAQHVASDGSRSHLQSDLASPEAAAGVAWGRHLETQAALEPGCTVRSATDPTPCDWWCTCGQPEGPCVPFGSLPPIVEWGADWPSYPGRAA